MIFLINNTDLWFVDMHCREEYESDCMAMAELTKEIGTLVQKSIDEGHKDLTPFDIEHILKMTADVTHKIEIQSPELTA